MLPGGVTQSFAYDDIGRLIDNIQYFFGFPKNSNSSFSTPNSWCMFARAKSAK